MKKLIAREVLQTVSYDLQRQLQDGTPTKTIYDGLQKRLGRIQDNKWQRVVWNE